MYKYLYNVQDCYSDRRFYGPMRRLGFSWIACASTTTYHSVMSTLPRLQWFLPKSPHSYSISAVVPQYIPAGSSFQSTFRYSFTGGSRWQHGASPLGLPANLISIHSDNPSSKHKAQVLFSYGACINRIILNRAVLGVRMLGPLASVASHQEFLLNTPHTTNMTYNACAQHFPTGSVNIRPYEIRCASIFINNTNNYLYLHLARAGLPRSSKRFSS